MMGSYETTLGTIRCNTSKATVDALLFSCGLGAQPADEPGHFDIVSRGRDSEPEVELDLWELALAKLHSAERDGSISSWAVVADRRRTS
jgi:hypothetical protein